MMKIRIWLLLLSLIFLGPVCAQMSRKEIRKAQWNGDMSNSGVGLSYYNTDFSDEKNPVGSWRGVNLLFGAFQMGFEQGYIHQSQFLPNETEAFRASSFYLGTSLPLPFLTIGKYRSYKNSFRLHPIINANFRTTRSYENERVDLKMFAIQGAIGYRLRVPFMSVDFTMNVQKGSWKPAQSGSYSATKYFTYPMITLRWDGLMDKFSPTFRSVAAIQTTAKVTGQSQSTNRERIDGVDYRVTRTTTNYQVTATPTTVAILDIGKYKGMGPKVTTNGIRSLAFREGSFLVGIQGMYRKGLIVLGGTIEAGRIGHGSELQERKNKGSAADGDNFYRRLDKSKRQGIGSYTAANAMVDFGFDFSSLRYGLFGLQVADNDATPFTSLSVGYSFGLNMLFGQQFSNESASNAYYNSLNSQNQSNYQRDNSYFEDPRNALFGLMGGWFISCDIGHASMRMQWYKYRRAPLANGLLFSVAWRFN